MRRQRVVQVNILEPRQRDRRTSADRRAEEVRRTEDVLTIVERRAKERAEYEALVRRQHRKPRQTRAMFIAHIEAYCSKKGKRNGLRSGR